MLRSTRLAPCCRATSSYRYSRLRFGSYAIWAATGALAADGIANPLAAVLSARIAGSLVGLTDATLGWWISWQIGPGRAPPEQAAPDRLAGVVMFVAALAGCFGALGGLVGRIFSAPAVEVPVAVPKLTPNRAAVCRVTPPSHWAARHPAGTGPIS